MGRSLPGAIHDQELVLEEKRLRDYGTDPARTEQPSQDGNEMDEKKGQIAHRRMVAGQGILRNLGRNNNSPDTGIVSDHLKDQFTDLLGDPAATAHWFSHFAEHGPVPFETGSMP